MSSTILRHPAAVTLFHGCPNPITLFPLFAFPECSSLAARAFWISRSSITCVIRHFAGSASALPA